MIEAESVVIYYKDGAVQINLDNILTLDHIVYPNMRVIKQECSNFDAVEILGIVDDDKYVYLTIKNIITGQVNVLSQILDWDNTHFLWSIISLEYLYTMLEEKIMARLIVRHIT